MIFKRKRLSISVKITLIYSAILFAILVVFAVITLFIAGIAIVNEVDGELKAALNTTNSYLTSLKSLEQADFKNLKPSNNIFYNIFDADKKLIYSNESGLPLIEPNSENSMVSLYRGKPDLLIAYINRKVTINQKSYYIQVTKSLGNYVQFAYAMEKPLIILCILGICICFISGRYLSRHILKPIRGISGTAKEITAKSLNKRIILDGPKDELKELADVFNSMVERLESDFEKQRRFMSDVSHELRTPLAVFTGYINMLDRWGKNDPQVLSQSLNSLKSEAERMDKLITNLLYLAKSDNNTFTPNKEKFTLNALLKEVSDETMLVYGKCRITCSVLDCEQTLTADYNAIKRVLRNLIDNSIKYSSPEEEIRIDTEQMPDGILITVSDKGIGIPPEYLPFIFDRFYRVDESRSKTTGGSGLGLSIAKHIVQSHNGTISAESEQGKGTKISVFLPQM